MNSSGALQAIDGADNESTSEIDDFIYLMSHDFRASLRALIELPQWIAEDLSDAGVQLDDKISSSIELMNRHTGRLDRMLTDLLAFSRIGRLQTLSTVDLSRAMDDVLEDVPLPAGFTLIRDFDAPHCEIGEHDIRTFFSAVLSNAIRHHDRPGGRIIVSTVQVGSSITISISDDGPGVPEQFRKSIFQPMTTLRPRDEVEGSGMGLACVNKIAQIYGGVAKMDASAYGRGSCLTLTLPQTEGN